MPYLQPQFVPETAHLNLEQDISIEPKEFSFSADGRMFVLSHLTNPPALSALVINVYDKDFAPYRIADLTNLDGSIKTNSTEIAVVGENVIVSDITNRSFLFDLNLETRTGAFAAPQTETLQAAYDQGLACKIKLTQDGRLICVVAYQPQNFGFFKPSLICLSDSTQLTPSHRPQFTCIARLEKTNSTGDAVFPYIHMPGGACAPCQNDSLPSLVTEAEQRFGLLLTLRPWLNQALPISDNRFLVSVFHGHMSSGKGLDFAFCIIDETGRLIGRLEGIDKFNESPFVEHHYRVAFDPAHNRIVYKNKTSFFLFDCNGQPVATVKLDGKPLSTLAAFKLGTCSVDGRVVLYHPKNHQILVLDPMAQPNELKDALEQAAEYVNKQRTALKKQYKCVNSNWLHPQPTIQHLKELILSPGG